MLFRYALVVPANQSEETPYTMDAPVATGILTKGLLVFPGGCKDMVGVRVAHMGQQLWPLNPGEWLVGNRSYIEIREDYDLRDTPATLTLYGASPGTSYNHTITVLFEVLSLEAARPWVFEHGLLDTLLYALGLKRKKKE